VREIEERRANITARRRVEQCCAEKRRWTEERQENRRERKEKWEKNSVAKSRGEGVDRRLPVCTVTGTGGTISAFSLRLSEARSTRSSSSCSAWCDVRVG
jgi:hypothetical protein